MSRKVSRQLVVILGVFFLVSYSKGAPEGKVKFPESATETELEADKVIDEIVSVSRSGRNLRLNVGGKDIEPLALASDPKFKEVSGQDTEARSFVASKLCDLGLAKCGEARHGHYGGLTNLRDVTLVQPVDIKPVGGPIAAIPLQGGSITGNSYNPSQGGSSSYNPGFGNYPSEDKNFPSYQPNQQGGLIAPQSGCTCVSVNQCNSYDIINSQSTGSYGVINGQGSPNYGHVGAGIDPRNKKSEIESNATVVEAISRSARNIEEIDTLSNSSNGTEHRARRDVSHLPNSNPRVVNGAYRSCNDDRLVCCRNPIRNPGGSTYPSERPSSYPSNSGVSNYPTDSYRPPPVYPGQRPVSNDYYPMGNSVCGRRNGINGRVLSGMYSGNNADFGEYPWQVAILKKEGKNSIFVGGGALIDNRHILTAAHIIKSYRPEDLRVRLGEWDVNSETEFYPHTEFDAAAIAIHPEYYAGNLVNDLAIVKINGYLDFSKNPHISPICLPSREFDFSGIRCFATGWGKDAFGQGGKFQKILQEVDVPVINNYECEQRLKRTRLGQDFTLHSGFLCAGGEPEKDACKGDGGGPLSCDVGGGNWQLGGIVSWGVGCGTYGTPGVYVKVSNYLNWIRTTIQ